MHVCGCAWTCIGVYGFEWIRMDLCGFAWICMYFYGFIWICMDLRGIAWICMDFYGFAKLRMHVSPAIPAGRGRSAQNIDLTKSYQPHDLFWDDGRCRGTWAFVSFIQRGHSLGHVRDYGSINFFSPPFFWTVESLS